MFCVTILINCEHFPRLDSRFKAEPRDSVSLVRQTLSFNVLGDGPHIYGWCFNQICIKVMPIARYCAIIIVCKLVIIVSLWPPPLSAYLYKSDSPWPKASAKSHETRPITYLSHLLYSSLSERQLCTMRLKTILLTQSVFLSG